MPAFPKKWLIVLLGLGIVIPLLQPLMPDLVSDYRLFLVSTMMIAAIAVLGLNLLTGFNGQISLGHGAFYAVGAYTAAILMDQANFPYWATLPFAAVICFIVGYLFGLPAPESMQGRSLLPVARGEPHRLREYAVSHLRLPYSVEWSIRTQQWFFVLPCPRGERPPRPPQLFIKPEDRWEVNNVLTQYPDAAEHLELALRRFQAALRDDRLAQPPELREEVLKIVQS